MLFLLDIGLILANWLCCKWVLDWAYDCTGIPRDQIDAYSRRLSQSAVKQQVKMRRLNQWIAKRASDPGKYIRRYYLANLSIAPGFISPLILLSASARPKLETLPGIVLLLMAVYCAVMLIAGRIYQKKKVITDTSVTKS